MQITNSVYSNQPSFGFNIKIKTGENLVDLKEAEIFANGLRARTNKLLEKAKGVFPDKTVVVDLKEINKTFRNAYNVGFLVDGNERLFFNGYKAESILYLLEKASMHLTTMHARMFYGTTKSPDLIKHGEKIKKALSR